MKFVLALLLLVGTSLAHAEGGVQVCVDSKGSSYTAAVTGHAGLPGWSAKLQGRGVIAPDTDLAKITLRGNLADVSTPSIEDMSYQLKHLVTPSLESLQEGAEFSYNDEPRVYQVSGVDLLCSSTMSQDEYASLAK
jgi:hypothetical protein